MIRKRLLLLIALAAVFIMQANAITEQDVNDLMAGPSGTTVTDIAKYNKDNLVHPSYTYTVYTRLGRCVLIQYMSVRGMSTSCHMITVPMSDFGSYVKGE